MCWAWRAKNQPEGEALSGFLAIIPMLYLHAGCAIPASVGVSSMGLPVAAPAGYRLHAFVELRDHTSTAPHAQTAQELTQWCREHLSPAAVPSDIVIVAELPRSSAGKLQRSRLRALIPTRQDAAGIAATAPASLRAEQ